MPSDSAYDSSVHLSVGDIAVDDSRRPSFLQITIKQSKTDPFRKGVDVFVGRTGSDLCPVAAVLDFLQARGISPDPLFLFEDRRPLTRQRFVVLVRDALRKVHIDQSKYCGHSFRIGCNHGGSKIERDGRLHHKDIGQVGELSVPAVRTSTLGTTGRLFLAVDIIIVLVGAQDLDL